MTMETRIIKKETMRTSNWSGGTTTQILIYPECSDYVKRDFLWRLSTAKVEVEESTFTSLPGINRILMILDGKLKIDHEGHHSKVLSQYDTDSFNGAWITKSYGKVTDFNLMMKDGVKGELSTITISNGTNCEYSTPGQDMNYENSTNFYYSPLNSASITFKGSEYNLEAGDLLYITDEKSSTNITFANKNHENITIVCGILCY